MNPNLSQLAITVESVEKALEFYRDILGLEFLFAPSKDLAFLQAGSVRIMLSTPQGSGEIGKNSVPYFSIESLEQRFKDIVTNGATLEREPALAAKMPDHDLWIGFVRDPDGNLIGLMEEIKFDS